MRRAVPALALLLAAASALPGASPRRRKPDPPPRLHLLELDAAGSARRIAPGQPYVLRFRLRVTRTGDMPEELPPIRVTVMPPPLDLSPGRPASHWVQPDDSGNYELQTSLVRPGEHWFLFESGSTRWVLAKVPLWTVKVEP